MLSGYGLIWIRCLHLVILTTCCLGVMYPFGADEGDTRTCPDDDMFTGPVRVQPFPFMGKMYTELYVNSNPILSLGRPFLEYEPENLPISSTLDDTNYFQLLESGADCVTFANFSSANISQEYYGLLAVFWADADPSANSPEASIYYRLTGDNQTLQMIERDVKKFYYPVETFDPAWAFILTYSNVTYYFGSSDTEKNTMQIVVASDGSKTFVFYNYLHVEWPNENSNYAEKALVGFDSSEGFCQVTQSMTPNIIALPHLTNIGLPGRWILRVDKPGFHEDNCSIKLSFTTVKTTTEQGTNTEVISSTVTEQNPPTTYSAVTTEDPTTILESTTAVMSSTITEQTNMLTDNTSKTMGSTNGLILETEPTTNQTLNPTSTVMNEYNQPSQFISYIITPDQKNLTLEGMSIQTTKVSTHRWSYGFRLDFACAPFPSWFDIQTHTMSVEYGDRISYWCKKGYEFSDKTERKFSLCSANDKTWHPVFMECHKIVSAYDESEYLKPVEAENAEFIGTVAVIFMFLEFLVMFIVDLPVWITIFRGWFQCCQFYVKRLHKQRKVHTPKAISMNDISFRSNNENVTGLNLI